MPRKRRYATNCPDVAGLLQPKWRSRPCFMQPISPKKPDFSPGNPILCLSVLFLSSFTRAQTACDSEPRRPSTRAFPACSAAYSCDKQGRGLVPSLVLLVVQVCAAPVGPRTGRRGFLSRPGFEEEGPFRVLVMYGHGRFGPCFCVLHWGSVRLVVAC